MLSNVLVLEKRSLLIALWGQFYCFNLLMLTNITHGDVALYFLAWDQNVALVLRGFINIFKILKNTDCWLFTLILLVFAVLFSQHPWHMVLVKVVSSLPWDELVTRCWYIHFSILKYQNDYAHDSGGTEVNTNLSCTRLAWIQINCVKFNTLKMYSR